jgi:hypothetical protein
VSLRGKVEAFGLRERGESRELLGFSRVSRIVRGEERGFGCDGIKIGLKEFTGEREFLCARVLLGYVCVRGCRVI